VLITRTYIKYLNSFYTTSFSILKNKEQATYEMLFEELEKKKKKKKKKNKLINIEIILRLVQKIFIVISKKVYLIQ